MIRSLMLAATAIALCSTNVDAQVTQRVHPVLLQPGVPSGLGSRAAAPRPGPARAAAPHLGPAMPVPASHVPALPPEAGEPSFGRTALFASIGSFAGLFGGGLIGFGLSDGEITNGAAVMTFSGSVVGATWAGAATSGRGGQAFLGSLLGSAAGIAFLASAQPEGLGGVLSYSLIQGITTAVATSF